ncbi:TPA: trypsin-like peptidase domain-containing protein [Escherichia coli]|nr:trypsin-like peptidase domain-containing protein [Escherichia coli]
MHQHIANATFQVIAGTSCGSGFSFLREDLVITNLHVIKPLVDLENGRTLGQATLITESGQEILAKILYVDIEYDFAVMRVSDPLPAGREVLQPSNNFNPVRGLRLIFAGYPHGFPQLLTSEAIISSPLEGGKFAIDGMVNGGNSGGPIVDLETGNVVGIVTQRRYPGKGEADDIGEKSKVLLGELRNMQINVRFGGVDFARINSLYAESLATIVKVLESNANPGIGIGFPIQPVIDVISTRNY